MIPLRAYAGRRVSVLSLKGAGLTAARALASGGAQLTVWDRDETRRAQAAALGLCVEDPTLRDWSDLAAVISGDPALFDEEPAPRLIGMARALELPLLTAETVLSEGYAECDAAFSAALGRQAIPALDFAAHLLSESGRRIIGPDTAKAPQNAPPGAGLLAAFDDPPAGMPHALCLLDGAGPAERLRPLVDHGAGPLVLSADDPAVRRLSLTGVRRACLVSGRSTLSRGVFVAAGQLVDAMDGRARRAADLSDSPGCTHAHPLALAAGYALARGLGLSFEDAREAVTGYAGCPAHGAPVGALGPLMIADWSSAHGPRAVADALSHTRPVVWLGGASVDPDLAALLDASGKAPAAAILTGDRRRAERKLSRLCPVHVERDLTAALALAVHCAMKAGPRACIVHAPGGPEEAGITDQIRDRLDSLVRRATQGDAA